MTQTHARPGAENTGANDESCRGTRLSADPTPIPDGMKRCTKCEEVKPHSAFHRNRKAADGLHPHCKACHAAYRADKKANSPVARWLRGELDVTPDGLEAWLLDRIERDGDDDACWTWQGAMHNRGYGRVTLDGVPAYAHHIALRLWLGIVVPEEMHVDHLCRDRSCCNPSHLEVVTPKVNVLRGIGPSAENAVKTHCDNGHPLTGENLYVRPDGGRDCRACRRNHSRAHYARTRNGELTPEQKLNRGIFARTITFNVTERSA
ncbi:HNH endonuclease signature motif containing protein [Rhodococcus aetherivorans]